MTDYDLAIAGGTVVTGDGPAASTIGIRHGRIAALVAHDQVLSARETIDASRLIVIPGLIDPHVHFHYPGYNYRSPEHEYDTESRSALVGGVTTVLRMHRDLEPYRDRLASEIALADRESRIDVGFHVTLMTDEHLDEVEAVATEHGISSFKLYQGYRGSAGSLQGIIGADDGYLFTAFRKIAAIGGVACVHAENSDISHRLAGELRGNGANTLADWALSRPGWAEYEAISRAGLLADRARCPLYIVHISSAEGMEAIADLRRRGVEVYAEVSVQYLTSSVESPAGKLAKVNPPLRTKAEVNALWSAVRSGLVDTIGTDHVAHTTAQSDREIWDIQPGFAGVATLLPSLASEALSRRAISWVDIVRLTSRNAARIFRLPGKGSISVGADADVVIVSPAEQVVSAEMLQSSSDYSIFQGQPLGYWPNVVISRGAIAMREGVVVRGAGEGRFLRRPLGEHPDSLILG